MRRPSRTRARYLLPLRIEMPKSNRRNQTPSPRETIQAAPPESSAHLIANADAPVLSASVPAVTNAAAASDVLTLRTLPNLLTLQAVAYAVIALAAVLLRVTNLDARPLAPAETETALAAWQFLNGNPVGAFSSPLLFTLDWLAFLMFGAFDLTARLLPAVLGAALVFVPLLARNALGRTGAVLASLLIAFSPSLVFFSRTLSGADLAVGGALSALILFWNYRESQNVRVLYAGAIFAALALTAHATAYAVLIPGALYFAMTWVWNRRGNTESAPEPEDDFEDRDEVKPWENTFVRAGALFALTYVLAATTFLLNRDGLGVAFNLLGTWLSGLSGVGTLTTPVNLLLVYEPVTLIFGLAGVVLALTLRGPDVPDAGLLKLAAVSALFAFVWYSLGSDKTPSNMLAVAMPLMLLAGWFVGNLMERAAVDIKVTGGWRSTISGEIPIFVMLLLLAALIYLQVGAFLQQTRFSPALDGFYRLLSASTPEPSLTAAFLTLAMITIILLAVFIGLSVLLVGLARTMTLLALAVFVLLFLGTLRTTWMLNSFMDEPLRELAAQTQTPLAVRDLVRDLEWHSHNRHGDAHIMRVVADEQLGTVGRWYLRDFPNVEWTAQVSNVLNAEAVVSPAVAPPPGNWMGQRYRIQGNWLLADTGGLDTWKWFMYRQGGGETWQTTMLWLPTEN